MSNWICTKCGETAGSKCPHQRTVFPTDQMATVLDSALAVHVVHLNRKTEAFFNLTIYEKCNRLEAVKVLKERLNVSNNTLKHAFCKHNWVRNSPTLTDCTFECTHENLSNPRAVIPTQPDNFSNVVDYAISISRRSIEIDLRDHNEKDANNELFGALKNHVSKFFESYEEERRKLTIEYIKRRLIKNDWAYTEQAFWVIDTERGLLMVNKDQIKLNDFESLQPLENFDVDSLSYDIRDEVKSCIKFFTLTKEGE